MSKTAQWIDRRQAVLALAAGALVVALAASLPIAKAADEDTQASVYLVFDPETGEFVTVHDSEGEAKAQETQEAIEAVADTGVAATPASGGDAAVSDTSTNPTLIVGLIVAVVIVGGALLFQRSRA